MNDNDVQRQVRRARISRALFTVPAVILAVLAAASLAGGALALAVMTALAAALFAVSALVATAWIRVLRGMLAPTGASLAPSLVPAPALDLTLAAAGSVTMAGLELGVARLTATLGPCAHPAAEPVDLLLTGERVAWVCPDCNAELPAGWKLTAKVPERPVPAVCECPDETRDTVWVHVPERATWVTSYCAACGRGTGTLTSAGSVQPSGTAALSGTGTLSARATWDDVAYPSEASQHFAQLARVGRESCIGPCLMCGERDRQRAADESVRQWIEEGRWEQR